VKWLGTVDALPEDWEQITSSAVEELSVQSVAELYPAMTVQRSVSGCKYKFRRYAAEDEAAEKSRIYTALSDSLPRTPLCGAEGCLLCFEYIEAAETGFASVHFQSLGAWLGNLAVETLDWESPGSCDAAYQFWLNDLEMGHFFSPAIIRLAKARYLKLRPARLLTSVNYWDAMPLNFGWKDGTLWLLDEKHLRPGILGVGLVKPRLFLPSQAYDLVVQGFGQPHLMSFIQEYEDFLEYYYRTYALWFYLRGMRIKATSFDKNPRLRRFRTAFIAALDVSEDGKRREQRYFTLHYPIQNARYFWMRIRRWWRRTVRAGTSKMVSPKSDD